MFGSIVDGDKIDLIGVYSFISDEVNSKPRFDLSKPVLQLVDLRNRLLCSFLHSAGHLISFTMRQDPYKWVPEKANHFEKEAFMEYYQPGASLQLEKGFKPENLVALIQKRVYDTISLKEGNDVTSEMVPYVQLGKYFEGGKVPSNLPRKNIRITMFGGEKGYCAPCEGTHIKKFSDFDRLNAKLTILRVKFDKKNVKVYYKVELPQ